MTSAIDQIVAAYVKLGNRKALQDLVDLRERLATNMRSRTDFNFSIALYQLDIEIAAAKSGLDRIRDAAAGEPEQQ